MTAPAVTAELTELTRPLAGLDWDDTAAVEAAAGPVLAALAEDRVLLGDLARRVPDDQRLAALSEHYDILDKLVLHDDPAGWRLRLHLFLPGHFDRPHNHRWTYRSTILRGAYQHTLYGLDDVLKGAENDLSAVVGSLQPYMVRTEKPGDSYTLHHRMVHAATAEPHTVTLILRGPSMKDRFLVSDRTTGEAWWQYGAAKESAEEAAAKRMRPDQIREVLETLADLSVL